MNLISMNRGKGKTNNIVAMFVVDAFKNDNVFFVTHDIRSAKLIEKHPLVVKFGLSEKVISVSMINTLRGYSAVPKFYVDELELVVQCLLGGVVAASINTENVVVL